MQATLTVMEAEAAPEHGDSGGAAWAGSRAGGFRIAFWRSGRPRMRGQEAWLGATSGKKPRAGRT